MRNRRSERTLFFLMAGALSALQGCASWRGNDAPLAPGGAKAVPPAAEVTTAKLAPIGENTIARYGGDIGTQSGAGTVTPVISLMPVAPPNYGSPGVAGPRPGYAFYPPPPPPGYYATTPHEPYERAVERAIAGGLIGGVIGAQVGSGSGRDVAAGVGAATGALIGLGASGNPCATPHGGTIAGAAVGGILGHQVGDGSGRTAATAFGALLGALAATQAGSTAPDCR